MPRLAIILPERRFPYELSMINKLTRFNVDVIWSRSRVPGLGASAFRLFRYLPFIGLQDILKPRSRLNLGDYDLILTRELYSFDSYLVSKERDRGKHIVLVWETLTRHPYYLFPPSSDQARFVARSSDLFVTFTNKARQHLLSHNIKQSKISLIYPSIPSPSARVAQNSKSDTIRFLYAGQLEHHKGVDILLDAFRRLPDPNLELMITGRGRLDRLVKSRQQRDPRITFRGWVSSDELDEIFRKSQVFCYPSIDAKFLGWKHWEEQFGYSLLRAMQSSLPIVATNCGAIEEVIGVHNMLVSQASVDHLTQAMMSLANDELLRARVGLENRNRANRMFDFERQCDVFQSSLVEVLRT